MPGIWNFITGNPDVIITGLGILAGWLGIKRKIAKHAATKAQIDRWTSTAAGFVVIAIRSGTFTDDNTAIESGLARFRTLAEMAGVEITPEHESQALLVVSEAVAAAGRVALEVELRRLGAAGDALEKRMRAMIAADDAARNKVVVK